MIDLSEILLKNKIGRKVHICPLTASQFLINIRVFEVYTTMVIDNYVCKKRV